MLRIFFVISLLCISFSYAENFFQEDEELENADDLIKTFQKENMEKGIEIAKNFIINKSETYFITGAIYIYIEGIKWLKDYYEGKRNIELDDLNLKQFKKDIQLLISARFYLAFKRENKKGLKYIDKLLKDFPESKFYGEIATFWKAMIHRNKSGFDKNEAEKAIEMANSMLSKTTNAIIKYYAKTGIISDVYDSQGRLDKKIEIINECIKEFKDNDYFLSQLYTGKGAALERLGKYDEAIKVVEEKYRVIKNEEEKISALYSIHNLYKEKGNYDKAEEQLIKIKREFPNYKNIDDEMKRFKEERKQKSKGR